MDYQVVCKVYSTVTTSFDRATRLFSEAVNFQLLNGWKPQGAVSVVLQDKYIVMTQALIKG